MELTEKPVRLLLTGFRGCGKSTELLRLKQDLEAKNYNVIYVNMEEYISLRVPANTADFWMVLAAAVDGLAFGTDLAAAPAPFERFFERIKNTLETSIVVQDAALKIGLVDLKLTFKNTSDFRTKLYAALGENRNLLIRECREYIDEGVAHLLRNAKTAGTVFLVDNFEKLRGDLYNSAEVRESAETIFVRESHLLDFNFHVVFTVPPWLKFTPAAPSADFGSNILVLPMCKVIERDTGGPDSKGVEVMMTLLRKRMDFKAIFEDPRPLQKLVVSSGGYTRDLLRFMQDVILQAYSSKYSMPIQVDHLTKFVENVIRDKTVAFDSSLADDVLPILARIAKDKAVNLSTADEVQKIAGLIDTQFIFAYLNGEPWEDLHPLLRASKRMKAAIELAQQAEVNARKTVIS